MLQYTSTVGPFCLAKVRGVAEWVGEDAVLQVRQWVGNGNYLYAVSLCFSSLFIFGYVYVCGCAFLHLFRLSLFIGHGKDRTGVKDMMITISISMC